MNIDFRINDNNNWNDKSFKAKGINKVLNIISESIVYNGVDDKGYTEISAKTFQTKFSNYKPYLKYLLNFNIIKRDYYILGKKSYGYRFTEAYKEKISINKIYIKRKGSEKATENMTVRIGEDIKSRIEKDFKSCDVIFNLRQNQLSKTKDEWGNFIDISKWLYNNIKMAEWKKGNTYIKWKSNRLYTNFTNISSHIRLENIKLNGEELVEFDIPNSFPLLLANYAIKQNPEIFKDYDYQNFTDLVINKKFYSHIQKKLNSIRNIGKSGDYGSKDTRLLTKIEAKQLFQQYLNGNSKKIAFVNGVRVDINYLMQQHFPTIHDIILNIKQAGNSVYEILVKMESTLIFDIIEEIYSKFDDIKLLTCHDAIYVPISYKDRVNEIWNKHIDNLIGELKYTPESTMDYVDFKKSLNLVYGDNNLMEKMKQENIQQQKLLNHFNTSGFPEPKMIINTDEIDSVLEDFPELNWSIINKSFESMETNDIKRLNNEYSDEFDDLFDRSSKLSFA